MENDVSHVLGQRLRKFAMLFLCLNPSVQDLLGQVHNYSPAQCQEALGIAVQLRQAGATAVAQPTTEASVLAEEIAPLLDSVYSLQSSDIEHFVDSLTVVHGKTVLHEAMALLLTGAVYSDQGVRLGQLYAEFGADPSYAVGIAVTPTAPLSQRVWAVEALGTLRVLDASIDTVAVPALCTVLCDMSYLLRPFVLSAVRGRYRPPVGSWFDKSLGLFDFALINIARVRINDAAEFLSSYVKWEPEPELREPAEEILRRAGER